MAPQEPSYLLRLPRELRNYIYSYLGVTQTLSVRDHNNVFERPFVGLSNSLRLCLLLVCRQLHDEYREVWSQRLEMTILMQKGVNLTLDAFSLRKAVPAQVFAQVKSCDVRFLLSSLRTELPEDLDEAFSLPYLVSQQQIAELSQMPSESTQFR